MKYFSKNAIDLSIRDDASRIEIEWGSADIVLTASEFEWIQECFDMVKESQPAEESKVGKDFVVVSNNEIKHHFPKGTVVKCVKELNKRVLELQGINRLGLELRQQVHIEDLVEIRQ